MPLQIELASEGRDRATLDIRGLPEVGSEVLVAVQRLTDDRYLTVHCLWDAAPGWHPCARLGPDDGGADDGTARFDAGPALTAGIRAAAGTPLRVHLRRGDYADAAPLDIPAAWRPPTAGPSPGSRVAADRAPEVGPPPTVGDAGRPLSGSWTTGAERDSGRVPQSRVRNPWRFALLALPVVVVLGSMWRWSPPQDAGPGGPAPPTARTVTGKDQYLTLKRQGLPAQDLAAAAQQADQAGDCEAAVRLFMDAAKQDAGFAERLGRRYDPEGFRPSPCFAEPKTDSALVWYQDAAEHGIPQAQRRYAELLLGEADAGPLYQDAVIWLRKAAAAGDAAAARRLAALGER